MSEATAYRCDGCYQVKERPSFAGTGNEATEIQFSTYGFPVTAENLRAVLQYAELDACSPNCFFDAVCKVAFMAASHHLAHRIVEMAFFYRDLPELDRVHTYGEFRDVVEQNRKEKANEESNSDEDSRANLIATGIFSKGS